ncbi:hypothetical protein ACEPAI_3194 [Sanghuangporus weigelae]
MSGLNLTSSLQIRSDAETVDPSSIRSFVSETNVSRYIAVSLITVLIYNSVITLDKEACNSRGIYRLKCSFLIDISPDILLQSFYWPPWWHLLHNQPPIHVYSCRFSVWADGLANLTTVVLIDYILLIRVLALYHQKVDRMLTIFLDLLLFLETVIDLAILIYGNLVQNITIGIITEGVVICGNTVNVPVALGIISWGMPAIYELILLVLALYKAAEYWKLSSRLEGFHLVRVLIRDQVLYYGLVVFCSSLQMAQVSLQDAGPVVANFLNGAGSPTLLCVLGGQLLINLKEEGEREANGGTDYTPRSVSDIEFNTGFSVSGRTSV